MRLFTQNGVRERCFERRLSRREREFRYALRVTLTVAALAGVAAGALLSAIAPGNKPLVTVYTRADCDSCLRWMQHIAARGFETKLGAESDWPAVRARFGLAPGFHSSHTAIVDGLLIEGPVPAHDIHVALEWRSSHDVLGLVVPGVPRGSPGMESPVPQRYTVFAVREGGVMQPFAVHDH
jgi:hypothetical protein